MRACMCVCACASVSGAKAILSDQHQSGIELEVWH